MHYYLSVRKRKRSVLVEKMSVSVEYLIAFAVIVVILFYRYFIQLYKIEQFFKNFPAPPTVPFLGNALDFPSTTAFLKSLHKYTKAYGTLVHVKIGPVGHMLLCSDYKFLEFLLTSTKLVQKSKNMRFLEPWLGKSLALADGGPTWRMHRKLITSAFHFKILEQFVEVFEASGSVLVQKLSKMSGSKSLDIYPYITRCTLDVICETAMGTKLDTQNSEKSSLYVRSVKEMCRIFLVRTTSVLKSNDFLFRFTEDYKIQKQSLNILHEFTNNIINKKREELKRKHLEEENVHDSKKKKVLLDLLLENSVDGQRLSPKEMREEVDTFMFGGHDTTATASSFILYCLANNKEAQDKVFEEQIKIFGDDHKGAKVTYANLQEMKYLENVIKEGLRLYPPAPVYGRHVHEDTEYNGMMIPKGITILIYAQGIHMNPEYYPDPEKFDPSRFENTQEKLPFSYIPFSAGPRNCIGQKYAMLELKSLLSKIVRNFELFPASPKHEMELAAETVLKSLNGVKIGLKSRQEKQ